MQNTKCKLQNEKYETQNAGQPAKVLLFGVIHHTLASIMHYIFWPGAEGQQANLAELELEICELKFQTQQILSE